MYCLLSISNRTLDEDNEQLQKNCYNFSIYALKQFEMIETQACNMSTLIDQIFCLKWLLFPSKCSAFFVG